MCARACPYPIYLPTYPPAHPPTPPLHPVHRRYIAPGVSRHYLKDSPYRALDRLMQGPVLVAYPEEATDRKIPTRTVLGLAKEFNLGLLGAKWNNAFWSAQELREVKAQNVSRGEVLSLFANYQRDIVRALNKHHEMETGTGEETEGASVAATGGEEAPPAK